MSDSFIEYFIWSVTLEQNKYFNSIQTVLTPQILSLLSEIDLKRFILFVLMKHPIKTKLLQSCFRDNNYASHSFFWKAFWLLPNFH